MKVISADLVGCVDLARVRRAVDGVLLEFLAGKERRLRSPHVPLFVGLLRDFLVAGGKRLRPVLCWCGWLAGGGQGEVTAVVRLAASLELLHTFALIHDDVMDVSETRRGRPTLQQLLAAVHPGHPTAERLGVNTAILLGDLALCWSYDLVATAGLDAATSAGVWPMLDAMRPNFWTASTWTCAPPAP